MPYPWVTDVTVKSNQLLLTVNMAGFTPGEVVELSGYATQDGGAFAIFSDVQKVREPTPDNKIINYVTSRSSAGFKNGPPVTVVMRAARVWAVVLSEPSTASHPQTPTPAGEGTTWNVTTGPTYSGPPSGGNVYQAPVGTEASFPGN